MSSIKVTLRKREYSSGKVSFYLDFYPAIKNPRTGEESRREYLGIYITKSPRSPYERKVNATKMKQAEAIRAQRELSLINEQYGFIDKGKFKTSAWNIITSGNANFQNRESPRQSIVWNQKSRQIRPNGRPTLPTANKTVSSPMNKPENAEK